MAVHTNVLSLCSGVGGLELGLKLADPSIRTVCYVEREAYAAAILVARMEEALLDVAPIWSDLTTFQGKCWRGMVDGITGGFPCQPWSVAGQRKGIEDERWLWPDIFRIILDVEPSWCFFENVPGLIKRGLPIVLGDLAALGFDAEWGVFSAAEVGAPHLRKRLYILGQSTGNRWREGRAEHEFWGRRDTTADSGLSVGYTNSQGLERWHRPLASRSDERSTWPPSPESSTGFPEGLEPAVCRTSDGLANRVDRLRACGNGVVPLAAANAYRVLRDRLG